MREVERINKLGKLLLDRPVEVRGCGHSDSLGIAAHRAREKKLRHTGLSDSTCRNSLGCVILKL